MKRVHSLLKRLLKNILTGKEIWIFAALLGLWIYLFLVFIGPFDIQPLSIYWRAQIMAGYGLLTALSSYLTDRLLNLDRLAKNSLSLSHLKFSILFLLLNFLPIFGYYRSQIVLGEQDLLSFMTNIYLPMSLVLIPFIVAVRYLIFRKEKKANEPELVIKGENKFDILRLKTDDLLYLKTSANYVEVHYKEIDKIRMKLLRSTLKEMIAKHPTLVQVHRSYAVNPQLITSWDGPKQLSIQGIKVPVSDSYKASLKQYF